MASGSEAILNALMLNNFIPDIFPEAPNLALLGEFKITYPTCEVLHGNELTPEITASEPSLSFAGVKDGVSYTLAMLDPDAPTRAEPIYRSFRHWVVSGVKKDPAGDGSKLQLPEKAITPFRAPGPRPNSGVHRYTFMLFKEPAGFVFPDNAKEYGKTLEERRSWNVTDFATDHGLTLVGINFFLVKAG